MNNYIEREVTKKKVQDFLTTSFNTIESVIGHLFEESAGYTDDKGWISVKKRWPAEGQQVLVTIKDESGDTSYSYTTTGWHISTGDHWIVDNELTGWVTHWMPLPEPPKEAKQ